MGIKYFSNLKLHLSIILSFLFLLISLSVNDINAQIVINDEDLLDGQIFSTEPIIGYRIASKEFFETSNIKKGKFGIPVEVFIKSAEATDSVREVILHRGIDISKAEVSDLVYASRIASEISRLPETETNSITINLKDEEIKVDPTLIVSLPETEIFMPSSSKTHI